MIEQCLLANYKLHGNHSFSILNDSTFTEGDTDLEILLLRREDNSYTGFQLFTRWYFDESFCALTLLAFGQLRFE